MARFSVLTLLGILLVGQLQGAEITGKYVESRDCDVWTGPCFANAESNLSGKNAVLAWKIDKGDFQDVNLEGLSIVAVIYASDTLGLKQTGPSKAILLVDKKANSHQRQALIQFAKKQAGQLLDNVLDIRNQDVSVTICKCTNETCADVDAGQARIKTRCLHEGSDKVCGNETAYYPPLSQGVDAKAAATVENSFTGRGLGHTWRDFNRRGSYVGSFVAR